MYQSENHAFQKLRARNLTNPQKQIQYIQNKKQANPHHYMHAQSGTKQAKQ